MTRKPFSRKMWATVLRGEIVFVKLTRGLAQAEAEIARSFDPKVFPVLVKEITKKKRKK